MDADKTLTAFWCIDSETGHEMLVDAFTRKILARRIAGVIIEHVGDSHEKNT